MGKREDGAGDGAGTAEVVREPLRRGGRAGPAGGGPTRTSGGGGGRLRRVSAPWAHGPRGR